jgi:hypothetical protein
MLCGVELGHGGFPAVSFLREHTGIAAPGLRQLAQFEWFSRAPFFFAWGCFRDFGSGALRCAAMDIPDVTVFKASHHEPVRQTFDL